MAGLAPEVPRALAGRYRLVRLLARGGMAEVWEGRDEVLSRPVAIKMLLPHLAADPSLRERFRREAVTAARLVHPGIVAIFDAGVEVIGDNGAAPGTVLSTGWSRDESVRLEMAWPEHPSTAFIVMELVRGETLKDLIGRAGPLPPELVLAIALQVTDALAHAHAHGLVHRDVKPANVLLRDEGPGLVRVKVADFGIAKAGATTNDLTANGALLGTPKYISPEQVEGREPDARADLYSLGVVMYEMLAGRPPFSSSSDMATALAHVQQPVPDLAMDRPEIPGPLTDIVGSLLVKDPGQRVGSALELGGALISARKRMGAPTMEPGAYLQLDGMSRTGELALDGGPEAAAGAALVLEGRAHATEQPRSAGPGSPVDAVAAGGTAAGGTAFMDRPLTAGQPGRPRPRRSGRVASLLVAGLLIAGSAAAVALLQTSRPRSRTAGPPADGASGSPGATSATTTPTVPITGVHELTLVHKGLQPRDHLSTLPDIISSGSAGVWQSFIYHGPDFGGYDGLGLVLQLSRRATLHQLAVTTSMSGWSAEVFVSSSDPSTLAGWGSPVSRQSDIHGNTAFSLGDKRGRSVLLWMLDPGPSRQAEVTRVSVH